MKLTKAIGLCAIVTVLVFITLRTYTRRDGNSTVVQPKHARKSTTKLLSSEKSTNRLPHPERSLIHTITTNSSTATPQPDKRSQAAQNGSATEDIRSIYKDVIAEDLVDIDAERGMYERLGKRHPSDVTIVKDTHNQGKVFFSQGQFSNALERFLWVYDHGTDINPPYKGVKNSFLLRDFEKLMRVYPPAIDALESRLKDLEKRSVVSDDADTRQDLEHLTKMFSRFQSKQ